MSRLRHYIVIAVMLTSVVVLVAGADPLDPKEIANFTQQFGGDWTIQFDQAGHVRSLAGRSTKMFQGHETEVIEKLLRLFDISKVKLTETTESIGGIHLHYEQVVENSALDPDGRPIENRPLIVSVDRESRLVGAATSDRVIPGEPKGAFYKNKKDFEKRLKQLGSHVLGFDGDGIQVPHFEIRDGPILFAKDDNTYVPAYRVWVYDDQGRARFEVVLDASSQSIPPPVETRELVWDAVPWTRGLVFRPNPRVSLRDAAIAFVDVPSENPNPYFPVFLPRLNPPNAHGQSLCGQYVCVDDANPAATEVMLTSSGGNFSTTTRGTALLPSVMIYYYIDGVQAYVQSLGFTCLANRSIKADPHGPDATRNAFYHFVDGTLEFDTDGKIYAGEDADVIVHEYAHALQASAAGARYSSNRQASAMREGFGDYLAMSYLEKENRDVGASGFCYGEWMNQEGCSRFIDVNKTIESFDPKADEHPNGTLWAAALWRLREKVGQQVADTLTLESHSYVYDKPSFCLGGMALLSADQALYDGHHGAAIKSVMRGMKVFENFDKNSDRKVFCDTRMIVATEN